MDELLEQVQRSPKHSSPGNDGLGYQYLHILFTIPSLQKLIWEIFTRVINLRLSSIANNIINPSQTGFMRRRFISDNGLLLHLIVQQARLSKHTGIGLLLDQEKAYDRVNPQYLVRVLTAFGFHERFIRCIKHLFFGNMVQINVNGYFTPNIEQQRGLRQGDPLSPILFNLALEPLLLAINQDNDMIGYRYVNAGIEHRVKTLAYADDICIIVDSVSDHNRLHHHLNRYSMVSNAKFNQEKTEAFALSGYSNETWKAHLLQQQISVYHTDRSSEPFRYLGYHIMFTTAQRSFYRAN
ncbi:hypothetical protein G6F43_013205 [Rhizopus delemar]|nr:hypothetical protein G6F43_013205 [Rhizopus delemar]